MKKACAEKNRRTLEVVKRILHNIRLKFPQRNITPIVQTFNSSSLWVPVEKAANNVAIYWRKHHGEVKAETYELFAVPEVEASLLINVTYSNYKIHMIVFLQVMTTSKILWNVQRNCSVNLYLSVNKSKYTLPKTFPRHTNSDTCI